MKIFFIAIIGLITFLGCSPDEVQHIRLEKVDNQTVIVTGDRAKPTSTSEERSGDLAEYGLKPNSCYYIGEEAKRTIIKKPPLMKGQP